jgi:hypothetical protein
MAENVGSPSLLAAIRAAAGPRRGRCSVTTMLETLSPEQLADFEAVIDDRTIDASVIGKVLRAAPYSKVIGDDALRRHRNRNCSCRPAVAS